MRRPLPAFPDHSYISDLSFTDDNTRHYLQTDDEDDGDDNDNELGDDSDNDDDLFKWEEETTLVAELLKDEYVVFVAHICVR